MIKGSETRKADYPVEKLLLDRWSPRAMSGEEISHEELMRLFEAARWAPSSFNTQQWRALYARRGTEHWQTFFDLLVDANKAWAKNAAVLVVFNTMLKSLGTGWPGAYKSTGRQALRSLRSGGEVFAGNCPLQFFTADPYDVEAASLSAQLPLSLSSTQ